MVLLVFFLEKKRSILNYKKRYRGYLTSSVLDRFLYHRMNNKSSILTSGEATSENTALGVMSEIKNNLSLQKSNFLFLLCLKIAII